MWPSTQRMHHELAFNDGRVAQSPECHQNRTERRELTKDCFHWHKKARCIMISARRQLPGPTGWAALSTYKQGWGKCLCVTFSRSLKLSLPGLSWAWRDCCFNRLRSNHQCQSSGSLPLSRRAVAACCFLRGGCRAHRSRAGCPLCKAFPVTTWVRGAATSLLAVRKCSLTGGTRPSPDSRRQTSQQEARNEWGKQKAFWSAKGKVLWERMKRVEGIRLKGLGEKDAWGKGVRKQATCVSAE